MSDSAQARTPSKTPSNGHASPAGTPTKSRGSNSPSGGGKALTAAQLAPKSTSYEFGGPPGALFVTLSVPFFAYLLYFGCNERVGCALLPTHPKLVFRQMGEGVLDSFKDTTAWAIYFGWYASTVLCWLVLPGKRVEGGELRTGGKLGYKMNGECAKRYAAGVMARAL